MIVPSAWYCSSSTPPGATRAARSARAAALVRGVHQAEAVEDHVGRLAVGRGASPRSASRPSQEPPCGLPYSATTPALRQQSRRGHPLHRVGGLRDERGGLGAPRLLGHGRVGQQLGQAAR